MADAAPERAHAHSVRAAEEAAREAEQRRAAADAAAQVEGPDEPSTDLPCPSW